MFGVDLSDWADESFPDVYARHGAIAVIELQVAILRARSQGDYCAERIAALASNWRAGHHNVIADYAIELRECKSRLDVLLPLRNEAMVPFRRRDGWVQGHE